LGDIKDIVIDPSSGQVAFVIVSSGGILGMGQERHVVPWNALSQDQQGRQLSLNIDQQRFAQAPKSQQDMSDRQWAREVAQFYGVAPYWEEGAQQQQQPQMRDQQMDRMHQDMMREQQSDQMEQQQQQGGEGQIR
jgi:hypothetical protein